LLFLKVILLKEVIELVKCVDHKNVKVEFYLFILPILSKISDYYFRYIRINLYNIRLFYEMKI